MDELKPRQPANAAERAALDLYWRTRIAFEQAMRATPPELLGVTADEIEGMIADIDIPSLPWPRTERRKGANGWMLAMPALAR